MTERVRKMVSLPYWAVAAIARADINLLIDRCEHATILIEQGDHPTVVMMSHNEWRLLTEARNAGLPGDGSDQHA